MKDLLTSGVHFGHQTRRWNPKMKQFIFGERGGIYIIDLQKTTVLIDEACDFLKKTAERGGSVLFVGTKKQCQETIQEQAERVGMPYVSNRWLGGLLTNFATLSKRIKRMHELRELSENGSLDLLPTREAMQLRADLRKLEQNLGGVGGMDRLPAAVFVVDPRKEAIVVKEARKLKIPIIGLVDTNCDPDEIDYIIPGNDDAIRSCSLIVRVMADAVAQGRQLLTEAEMKAEAERKAAEEAAVAAAVAAAEQEAAEQAAAAAADAAKAEGPGGRSGQGRRRDRRAGAVRTRSRRRPPRPRLRPSRPPRSPRPSLRPSLRPRPRPRLKRSLSPRPRSPRRRPRRRPEGRAQGRAKAKAEKAAAKAEAKPAEEARREEAEPPRRPSRQEGRAQGRGAQGREEAEGRGRGREAGRVTPERRTTPTLRKDRAVAEITAALVKELREKSGAGMMDCKKALTATAGDLEKAMDELRKSGLATAQKKSARATKDGAVDSYIHAGGKIGVLVEVGVETDFVSRSEPFREFTHDLAMQVAAASPIWVSRDEVPEDVVEREKAIYAESDQIKGKPENVIEKIITGKLEKFFGETCLMEQAFVKDPDRTIEQVRTDLVGVIGENVEVRRFVRFQLGETTVAG